MKDSKYWRDRFIQLEQAQYQQSTGCRAHIETQYRKAMTDIEGQLAKWYLRFAKNNEVNLTEAKKMLDAKELEELKWDVREYIRHGEENAINQQWMKQLENASARYHISRLEALKLQMQQSIEVMYGDQLSSIDKAIRSIYKAGYYHTAFEIHKGIGIGWNFALLDEKTISKVINKPWAADGKNFSERIWENRQKLVRELNTELVQSIMLGKDPQKAIDAIAKRMNVSKYNAGRLVMTESAFARCAAQNNCFKELDVELYRIVATLDSRTSETCQEMDGKEFPLSQYEIGTTAPPFHVWCRTTTVPVFGDEFDKVGKRAARGKDGKTYYVDSNMTYKEWHKAFVEGDKSDLKEAKQDEGAAMLPTGTAQAVQSNTVQGKNLINEIDYQDSDLDFVIEKAMHAQGFDGLPSVLEYDEFKKAMEKSDFYAERTYSAKTQERLDQYRDDLYNGKWYVDCSEGGAQYGQGMYCASCYDLSNNQSVDGIGLEMSHYKRIGIDRGNTFSYVEGFTIQPDAKVLVLPKGAKADEFIGDLYRHEYLKKYAAKEQLEQVNRYIKCDLKIQQITTDDSIDYIDLLYQERANATVGIEQLLKDAFEAMEDTTDGREYHGLKNSGALAVEMGYDVIKAEGHGDSGSYSVILNRTKVIFYKGGSIYGN
ncbi:MAG: minor capsid protein [Bacteroidales bacterium]|nr:minor capsid protein [Lachnoclostridium sp.]MCM1385133.1 minor capsid protein [Lachnoclostridium sp.]MCM1465535.1 minor capsid protein [Bacteroidales bacterium]